MNEKQEIAAMVEHYRAMAHGDVSEALRLMAGRLYAEKRGAVVVDFASVQDAEIVIRIPVSAIAYQVEPRGFIVTDPELFAPHVARELSGEDTGERMWIEPFIEAAIIRAAEGDAPGIIWDDASAESQALDEGDNDKV